MERSGKAWVGETEASRMLGVGVSMIRSMGKSGRVQVRKTPGAKAMTKYSTADLAGVASSIEEAASAGQAIGADGSVNLCGSVPDWTNETFVGRMDSCWMFMTAYGILDRRESEAARGRVEDLIGRSGCRGHFRCVQAPGDVETFH